MHAIDTGVRHYLTLHTLDTVLSGYSMLRAGYACTYSIAIYIYVGTAQALAEQVHEQYHAVTLGNEKEYMFHRSIKQ